MNIWVYVLIFVNIIKDHYIMRGRGLPSGVCYWLCVTSLDIKIDMIDRRIT